jgi:hypothetical protein
LEEAKRFILNGEVARLRLAVILLDNAVEVILHRRVNDALRSANMYARMLQRFPDGQLDAKGEALRQEIAAKTIAQARQKKVARFFGEKLTLLREDGELPAATARARSATCTTTVTSCSITTMSGRNRSVLPR